MNNVSTGERLTVKKESSWIADNIVTLIFVAFTLFGFMVSDGVSINYFLTELSSRFFMPNSRISFLTLSMSTLDKFLLPKVSSKNFLSETETF